MIFLNFFFELLLSPPHLSPSLNEPGPPCSQRLGIQQTVHAVRGVSVVIGGVAGLSGVGEGHAEPGLCGGAHGV